MTIINMVAIYGQSNYCRLYENVKYGPQAITMYSEAMYMYMYMYSERVHGSYV